MTGRSLPGDLQRLLGARRTAGARSPSAGISKARSPGAARTGGSGAPAPTRRPRRDPAPAPPPVPRPRHPGCGRFRLPGRQRREAARLRSAPRGARRRVRPLVCAGAPSLPLPAGSRPPFSRRSLSVPSSALPRPRLRWRGPGLPPQAKAADALSQPGPPGYFSNAVTVFKTQGEKTCTETKRASSVRAKLA